MRRFGTRSLRGLILVGVFGITACAGAPPDLADQTCVETVTDDYGFENDLLCELNEQISDEQPAAGEVADERSVAVAQDAVDGRTFLRSLLRRTMAVGSCGSSATRQLPSHESIGEARRAELDAAFLHAANRCADDPPRQRREALGRLAVALESATDQPDRSRVAPQGVPAGARIAVALDRLSELLILDSNDHTNFWHGTNHLGHVRSLAVEAGQLDVLILGTSVARRAINAAALSDEIDLKVFNGGVTAAWPERLAHIAPTLLEVGNPERVVVAFEPELLIRSHRCQSAALPPTQLRQVLVDLDPDLESSAEIAVAYPVTAVPVEQYDMVHPDHSSGDAAPRVDTDASWASRRARPNWQAALDDVRSAASNGTCRERFEAARALLSDLATHSSTATLVLLPRSPELFADDVVAAAAARANAELVEIARELDLSVVDLRTLDIDARQYADLYHPNSEGQRLITERLGEALAG